MDTFEWFEYKKVEIWVRLTKPYFVLTKTAACFHKFRVIITSSLPVTVSMMLSCGNKVVIVSVEVDIDGEWNYIESRKSLINHN